MMRDSPCVEPWACGGECRSKQTTWTPRLASLQDVAAPIAPPPITATRTSVRRDSRDRLSRHHGVADLEQQGLDDARDGGGDLAVDLVGVRLHQGLALVHVLALLLAPRPDRDLFGALQLRHHHFRDLDAHALIVARHWVGRVSPSAGFADTSP